jgi:uncharacterized phage-associated protein
MSKTEHTSHDIRAVANYMMDRANERGISLTLMQLLKLLYFTYGWSLVFMDRPITFNAPQAWQHGPVYSRVYKELAGVGALPVHRRLVDKSTGEVFYPVDISQGQQLLVNDVLSSYGSKHAFELSGITHDDGTPWKYTIDHIGLYKDIPEHKMRDHFGELMNQRNLSPERYT